MYFSITDDNRSEYNNIPPQMPQSNTVIGCREVLRKSDIHVLIKITEMYPMAGRQYYNFYNVGNWDGWKVITPQ